MRSLAILLLAASAASAQSLKVTVPATGEVNDTLAATAIAYAKPIGTRAPARSTSSKVTWTTRPSGAIRIVPTNATGQAAIIIGVAPGASWAIASWKHSNGTTYRDSGQVTIARPKVVVVQPFWSTTMTASGMQLVTTLNIDKGKTACLYVEAYDKRGNILTGRTIDAMISLNPQVATVGTFQGTLPSPCPDTSVSRYRIGWKLPNYSAAND